MAINIGIKEKDRKQIADGLARLLADTYHEKSAWMLRSLLEQ